MTVAFGPAGETTLTLSTSGKGSAFCSEGQSVHFAVKGSQSILQ